MIRVSFCPNAGPQTGVVQAAALPAKACWIDPDYANPRAA